MILRPFRVGIIPLREIIGNYNPYADGKKGQTIIPLREIIGNYNSSLAANQSATNYTLERDNRELQQVDSMATI